MTISIIPETVQLTTLRINNSYTNSQYEFTENILSKIKINCSYTELIYFEYDKGLDLKITSKIIFFKLNENIINDYLCHHLLKIIHIHNKYEYKKVKIEIKDSNSVNFGYEVLHPKNKILL